MKTFDEWLRDKGYVASSSQKMMNGYLEYALAFDREYERKTADALFHLARKITDPSLMHSFSKCQEGKLDSYSQEEYEAGQRRSQREGQKVGYSKGLNEGLNKGGYSKGLNEGLNKVKRDAKQTEELEYKRGQTDGYARGYRLGMADDRKDKKEAYDRGHKAGKKLEYAFGEMEKQLNPFISMPYDPSMKFAVDQAHHQGYSKGLNEGLNKVKRDAKQTEELEYKRGQTDGYARGYRLGMADDVW